MLLSAVIIELKGREMVAPSRVGDEVQQGELVWVPSQGQPHSLFEPVFSW
jgi:hypothetical protein